jgi:hypothetical protein
MYKHDDRSRGTSGANTLYAQFEIQGWPLDNSPAKNKGSH